MGLGETGARRTASGPTRDPTVDRRAVGPGQENGAHSPERENFPPRVLLAGARHRCCFFRGVSLHFPPAQQGGRAGAGAGGTCHFQGASTEAQGGNHTWTHEAACRLGAAGCFWNVLGGNPTPTLFGVCARVLAHFTSLRLFQAPVVSEFKGRVWGVGGWWAQREQWEQPGT